VTHHLRADHENKRVSRSQPTVGNQARTSGILGTSRRKPRPTRRGTVVDGRQLEDLVSIGPAMLRDFELLGIRSVAQLARQNPQRLYARLNRIQAQRQDPCVLDVFSAAVAQAQNPRLPAAQCQWWYWSKKRKQ